MPLISQTLPGEWWLSSTLFPPLNDAYRLPALLTAGLVTALVYTLADSSFLKSQKRRLLLQGAAFALVAVGLSLYVITTERFVKTVEIQSAGVTVPITVGYERAVFARQTFGDVTDEEMLRRRGVNDEEVYRLWTPRSVYVARWALLMSYVLFLAAAVAVFSLQVLYSIPGQT